MVSISLYSQNVIPLDDPQIIEANFNVKFTVLNDIGKTAKDTNGTDIKDITATFNDEKKKYEATFQLHPDSKGKYYRLIFNITSNAGIFVLSDFAIVELVMQKAASISRLVPTGYFVDYTVNGDLDPDTKEVISKYPKDAIEEWLLSAAGQLEDEVKLSFTPKTISEEAHDWYAENMRQTYWMIQTFKYPIISVENYSLWYAHEKIIDIEPKYLQLNKGMGIIEFVPTSDSPFIVVYQHSLEAITLSLFTRSGGMDRIPDVFKVSYTHGLDFMNLDEIEQSNIRTAIARRAMINALPRISPDIVKGSESQAVDGVSYSQNNRGFEWLQHEKASEREWINAFRRKYNTQVEFAVM